MLANMNSYEDMHAQAGMLCVLAGSIRAMAIERVFICVYLFRVIRTCYMRVSIYYVYTYTHICI